MTDPSAIRLRDARDAVRITDSGSQATELERELLLAGQDVSLSAHEKQAIWAAVALQCWPVALVPAAASSGVPASAKVGLGWSPVLKGLAVVAGLGAASGAATLLVGASRPAFHSVVARASASARAVTAPVRSSAPIVPLEDAAASVAPVVASAAPDHSPTVVLNQSALRDESAAVLEVRRTLQAGDGRTASRLLERARQRFPHGALGQEREALNVEALAKCGEAEAASRQAAAFLRAHPKSPYAADVQSYNPR